jgi:hypothetical protein
MIGDLLLACVVTVIAETALFWLFGYRGRDEIIVVVCTNVITNLLLNLVLSGIFFSVWGWMIVLGELVVIAVETAVYTYAFGRFGKVLALTAAANVLSVLIGLLLLTGTRAVLIPWKESVV